MIGYINHMSWIFVIVFALPFSAKAGNSGGTFLTIKSSRNTSSINDTQRFGSGGGRLSTLGAFTAKPIRISPDDYRRTKMRLSIHPEVKLPRTDILVKKDRKLILTTDFGKLVVPKAALPQKAQ